ncbi:MAG: thiolase family protein [Chloroflexi bacterium]|nr:thiolase family protein [Chloroflexota bacterium]
MTLRGAVALIGIGEVKPERRMDGRTALGLAAQAARECIADSGLRKDEVDGLITEIPTGNPTVLADYLGIRPVYSTGVQMMGASGATSIATAAAAIHAGLASNVLCVVGGPAPGGEHGGGPGAPDYRRQQFDAPYGPVVAANGGYALIAQRYKYEFGTTDEQRAAVAVQQRFNALANPAAVFYGQPITKDDVLNSRVVADPLRLLECVMPVGGAAAVIVSAADRARYSPHPPVYLLGAGMCVDHDAIPYAPTMTTSPVAVSARRAFAMAELGPRDMDMLSIYDCYTITVIICLEDAGFAPKGEGGAFIESTDVTYRGTLPLNTHGGQLSFGQPGLAGGMSHVVESVRQMMGRGGERQVRDLDYCFVNG